MDGGQGLRWAPFQIVRVDAELAMRERTAAKDTPIGEECQRVGIAETERGGGEWHIEAMEMFFVPKLLDTIQSTEWTTLRGSFQIGGSAISELSVQSPAPKVNLVLFRDKSRMVMTRANADNAAPFANYFLAIFKFGLFPRGIQLAHGSALPCRFRTVQIG